MCPHPFFDTLSCSPKHLPFRHIPSARTLTAGTTEAVQTCFFEQRNRESATLAFPGYIYKIGIQEGSYYPDASKAATKQHTRTKSLNKIHHQW